MALKSDTAAEESKDQLSRDFSGRSISDFCNSIGGKADIPPQGCDFRFLTQIRRAGAARGLASLRQEAIVGKLAVTMAKKHE